MLLTEEDRIKFQLWLKNQIDSTQKIIKQMEDMGLSEILLKRQRAEVLGCKVVLSMLDVETQTIG